MKMHKCCRGWEGIWERRGEGNGKEERRNGQQSWEAERNSVIVLSISHINIRIACTIVTNPCPPQGGSK